MKERPILFSAPMIRAILDGTKTMTRRVVKDQGLDIISFIDGNNNLTGEYGVCQESFRVITKHIRCPYGAPGDRLWCKEAWRTWIGHDSLKPSEIGSYGPVRYESDGRWEGGANDPGRYRSSRFMPRWASRITLEVASVKVERLQDISEEDALREGVRRFEYTAGRLSPCVPMTDEESQRVLTSAFGVERLALGCMESSSVRAFTHLWDSLNAKKPGQSWADNPWVWGIEFKRLAS